MKLTKKELKEPMFTTWGRLLRLIKDNRLPERQLLLAEKFNQDLSNSKVEENYFNDKANKKLQKYLYNDALEAESTGN